MKFVNSSDIGQLEREKKEIFLKYVSKLLEELITSPLSKSLQPQNISKYSFHSDSLSERYKGTLNGRSVLIKKYEVDLRNHDR